MKLACAVLIVAAGGYLSGCAASQQETSGTDEDFFAPLDSSQLPAVAKKPVGVSNEQPLNKAPSSQDTSRVEFLDFTPDSGKPAGNQAQNEALLPKTTPSQPARLTLGKYTVESLKDSINLVAEQVSLLQNILEASTVDRRMYFHTHVKAWAVNNPALRDSLFYALMAVDSSIQSEAGSDAEILATEGDDLIEARFGTAVFKGVTLKQALEKSSDKLLYQKVLESSRYSRDIELRDTTFTLPTLYEAGLMPKDMLLDRFSYLKVHSNPQFERARADISVYGLSFRIGPVWGGEVRIGNDELAMPFWLSGKTTFYAMYKQIKMGFELPTAIGRGNSDKFLFPLRDRLLNGTRGFASEFDFGSVGGYISSTKFTDGDINTLTDPDHFYYITDELLGYTSFAFSISQTNWARIKVGVGNYQVRLGSVVHGGVLPTGSAVGEQVVEMDKFSYSSPYLNIDYFHEDGDEAYGGILQYFDASIMSTLWLQIVPRYLRLEIKYSKPILRNLREWENPDFIIISPRLLLSF